MVFRRLKVGQLTIGLLPCANTSRTIVVQGDAKNIIPPLELAESRGALLEASHMLEDLRADHLIGVGEMAHVLALTALFSCAWRV